MDSPGFVQRFSRTERAIHWIHAGAFFLLLATGLVLYLPSLSIAVGNRPLVKAAHIYVAVAWAVALLLVVLVGDRRGLRETLRDLDRYDGDDRRRLTARSAPQGRFNAGQKVNAALTAAFAVLFAVSGFLLWYGERDADFRWTSALLLHDLLTIVSVLLLSGHLYLALIHPPTRHSLRGVVRGSVRADWAARHHSKWIASDLRTTATKTDPAGRTETPPP
jgi:formate dehydrogenase subunit gamma